MEKPIVIYGHILKTPELVPFEPIFSKVIPRQPGDPKSLILYVIGTD